MVTDPKSLHYVNPSNPDILNSYQEAIISAADILLEYDADKLVPVYGFGANLNFPNLKTTGASHCFPCSGLTQMKAEEVFGIQGILEVYQYCMVHVMLNGPTFFAPLFQTILNICKQRNAEAPDNYCFFMVITDGEIHDFDKTADVIVEACDHPMSIVILGVGEADFTNMRRFDAANFTDSKGQKPKRDIVRFVKFNDFKQSRMALSKELLAEIPVQVEQFYKQVPFRSRNPSRVSMHKGPILNTQQVQVGIPSNNPFLMAHAHSLQAPQRLNTNYPPAPPGA